MVGTGAAKLVHYGRFASDARAVASSTLLPPYYGHGRLWSSHGETNSSLFKSLGPNSDPDMVKRVVG